MLVSLGKPKARILYQDDHTLLCTCRPQDIAVVLLNRADAPATLSVTWAELGIPPGQHMRVRDVANRKDLPVAIGKFSAIVGTHDVSFVRLTHDSDAEPAAAVVLRNTALPRDVRGGMSL